MSSPDLNDRRLRVAEQVGRLPAGHLDALERFLQTLSRGGPGLEQGAATEPAARDWPHAPLHRLSEHGTYLVTAGTYRKEHHFGPPDRRDHLEAALLAAAKGAGWRLEAWAVFSNHYHFVGHSQDGSRPLTEWLAQLHQQSAAHVNQLDRERGRQVWFNFWETEPDV